MHKLGKDATDDAEKNLDAFRAKSNGSPADWPGRSGRDDGRLTPADRPIRVGL